MGENSKFSILQWMSDIDDKKMLDSHRDVRRFIVEKFSRTSTAYSIIDGDDFESAPENGLMISEKMNCTDAPDELEFQRIVFIENLPYDICREDIHKVFSQVGAISSSGITFDLKSEKPAVYGFIKFRDTETAKLAFLDYNDYLVKGRRVKIVEQKHYYYMRQNPMNTNANGGSGAWIAGELIEDSEIFETEYEPDVWETTSRVLWKRTQQEHASVSDENSRFSIPQWISNIGNKKLVDFTRDAGRFVADTFSTTSTNDMISEELSILIKFESKSERVNGISLHSRWPWILAALNNGTIQLWDYETGRLLEEFKGHEGAVSGICFNKNEPIFVSGGDDAKVKVWSYETKECIFTLFGHRGCIRTTFFHDKYPWIISASDDKTARIWNFKTRRCFSKFDHRTAVTCAQFHTSGPTYFVGGSICKSSQDVVATASLNEFIRVWDLTDFVKAQKRGGGTVKDVKELDFLSSLHAPCTYGFQWVAFHPRLDHIISGSNNRRIDRSKFNRKEVRAIGSFRAHKSTVSSVLYHPTEQLIVSCSKDKWLRISNISNSKFRLIYRHENDRFWALGAHPRRGILAAGHDNGMLVFKTRRERPVYCSNGDLIYYVADGCILEHDVNQRKIITVCELQSPLTFHQQYYRLSVNSDSNAFLLTTRSRNREICKLELYKYGNPEVIIDYGTAAVWITNNRFVVQENSRNISVRDLTNKVLYNFDKTTVDDIFYSGRGTILLKKGSELQLFNVLQQIVQASTMIKERIRYVIWSKSMKTAALLSKDIIILVNRKLKILCIQKDKAKSGEWDGDSVFVYNTKTHVKYLITSGDSGIIKSSDTLFYISKLKGNSYFPIMYYMYGEPLSDKVRKSSYVHLNASEYKAKLELINGNAHRAIEIIRKSKRVGQSLIDLFGKCGYQRIPLELVKNDKARFHLALEYDDLLIATRAAFRIKEVGFWKILGETALLRGDYQCAQICYHVIGDSEKLLFLHFVGGNVENIVPGAARMNVHAQFQAALLIGDMKERIKILRNCEQFGLAYLAAATHGYFDEAEELKDELESREVPIPAIDPDARLLIPPPTILRMDTKWPTLKLEPEVEINVKKSTKKKNVEYEEEQCQMIKRRTKKFLKNRN